MSASACVSECSAVRIAGSWLESLPVVKLMLQKMTVPNFGTKIQLSALAAHGGCNESKKKRKGNNANSLITETD